MAVYAIACGDEWVKIGTANNPEHRRQDLQSGVPMKLELLAAREGGHREEKALHRHLAASRVRGEWFRLVGEERQWLLEVLHHRLPYPAIEPVPDLRPILPSQDGLISVAEVAAHLDVTPSRVSQIAKRPSFPEPVRTIGRIRLWDRRAILAWAKTWDRGFQGGRGRAAV